MPSGLPPDIGIPVCPAWALHASAVRSLLGSLFLSRLRGISVEIQLSTLELLRHLLRRGRTFARGCLGLLLHLFGLVGGLSRGLLGTLCRRLCFLLQPFCLLLRLLRLLQRLFQHSSQSP